MQDFDGAAGGNAPRGKGAGEPFYIKVTESQAAEKRRLNVARILKISVAETTGAIVRYLTSDDPKGAFEDIAVEETAKQLVDMINGEPSDDDVNEWEREILRQSTEKARDELSGLDQEEAQAKERQKEQYERELAAKQQRKTTLESEVLGLLRQISANPKVQAAYELFDKTHHGRDIYGRRSQKPDEGFLKGRAVRQWSKMQQQFHRGRFPELALVLDFEKKKEELHLADRGVQDMVKARESRLSVRDRDFTMRRYYLERQLQNPFMTREDKVRLQSIVDGYKKEHGAPAEFRFKEMRRMGGAYENAAHNERLRLERAQELGRGARRVRGVGLSRSRGYTRER